MTKSRSRKLLEDRLRGQIRTLKDVIKKKNELIKRLKTEGTK
jgi:hypothetical protein